MKKYSGIKQWPGVTINNVTYKGSLIAKDIVEDVCVSEKDITKKCKLFLDDKKVMESNNYDDGNSSTSLGFIVFVVVLVVVIFFFVMVCIYKRMVKKEIS